MESENINSITSSHFANVDDLVYRGVTTTGGKQSWNSIKQPTIKINNSDLKILELEKQVKELLNSRIDSLPMITSGIFSLNSETPVSPATLKEIHDRLKEAYDIDDITLINASGNLEELDASKIRELIALLQDVEFKNSKEHLDEVVKNSSYYLEGFYNIIKKILAIYNTPYLETEVIIKQIPQVSYEDQEIVIKFKRN